MAVLKSSSRSNSRQVTSQVWTAAIVVGLAVVVTGAIAFSEVGAQSREAVPSLETRVGGLEKRMSSIESKVQELAKAPASRPAVTLGGGASSGMDVQRVLLPLCKQQCGEEVAKYPGFSKGSAAYKLANEACFKMRCQGDLSYCPGGNDEPLSGLMTGRTVIACTWTQFGRVLTDMRNLKMKESPALAERFNVKIEQCGATCLAKAESCKKRIESLSTADQQKALDQLLKVTGEKNIDEKVEVYQSCNFENIACQINCL